MTDRLLFEIFATPITAFELFGALGAFAALLLALAVLRGGRRAEMDAQMAALARNHAEMAGRMQTLAEILGGRQMDFARAVAEKLDSSAHRVNERLDTSSRATLANLGALNERLAVIDAAQARLTGLTQEVVGLKDILSNKQARGAFGQGRMEAIIRDALPANAYKFQHTLSTGARPDCVLRLPGDDKFLAVDAKFPLEAFSALKEAEKAVTRFRVIERGKDFDLVECELETGRKNQIRVHMAHIGHPVAGDPVYGGRRFKMGKMSEERRKPVQDALEALHGQALHARRLAFTHPLTGEAMSFEAPPPPDIEAFLTFLRSGGENAH